jgi:hypothetical protein
MLGDSPIRATGEFLGAAQRGDNARRFQISPTLERIGSNLPKGARALFHHDRLRLGLATQFVDDAPGWQGKKEYLNTDSPRATLELLRNIGVTHALWERQRGAMSRADIAREAVFARATAEYVTQKKTIDGWQIGTLRERPADVASANRVTTIAWLACDADAIPGIYSPRSLAMGTPLRRTVPIFQPTDAINELSKANVAITRARCQTMSAALGVLNLEFSQAAQLGDLTLWIRNGPSHA